MPRARKVTDGQGGPYGISFDCPGCGDRHAIPTTGPHACGFNGSMDGPTLTPSILVTGKHCGDPGCAPVEHRVCHSFVTDGRIQFLSDCTHALAGSTVDLPEVE